MTNHMWVILLKKYIECDTISTDISRKLKKAKILWYAAVAVLGGLYYAALEILWRGYSHWTMVLVGGGAVLCMYTVFDDKYSIPLVLKCALSALSVCVLEFFSGCIINLLFGLAVWDYSQLKFNLLGQVCPLFFCVWFALSIPAYCVCCIVHRLENNFISGVLYREE